MSRILVDQIRSNSASGDAITLDGNGKCAVNATTINSLTFPTSDGSADQIIKTDGSGALSFVAAPSGNTKHISTTSISSDSSDIIISNAFNEYPVYKIYLVNVRCTSSNRDILMRARNASGDMNSNNKSRASHALGSHFSTDSYFRLNYHNTGDSGQNAFNATLEISGFAANKTLRYYGLSAYQQDNGNTEGDFFNGTNDSSDAVVGLKFYWSGGSFSGSTDGKIILFGVNNA